VDFVFVFIPVNPRPLPCDPHHPCRHL